MSGRPTKPKAAPQAERGLDLYQTPAEATWAVIEAEREYMPRALVEPACGRGAIVRVLREAGYDVIGSDVRLYRGRPSDTVKLDFLRDALPARMRTGRGVITNPPFGPASRFIARAVTLFPWCAFLLRLAFIEGGVGRTADAIDRRYVLDVHLPARIHVFRRRLPRMHRDGWRGKTSQSDTTYAWFVWDRRSIGQPTTIHRIDWRPLDPTLVPRSAGRSGG